MFFCRFFFVVLVLDGVVAVDLGEFFGFGDFDDEDVDFAVAVVETLGIVFGVAF